MERIPLLDLNAQYRVIRDEAISAVAFLILRSVRLYFSASILSCAALMDTSRARISS